MAKLLAVDRGFFSHVGAGLGRMAPRTQWVQVPLAVFAAVYDRLDVIAGPRVAGPDLPSAAAVERITAAAEALQYAKPDTRGHGRVVGLANPFWEGAGHASPSRRCRGR